MPQVERNGHSRQQRESGRTVQNNRRRMGRFTTRNVVASAARRGVSQQITAHQRPVLFTGGNHAVRVWRVGTGVVETT